MASLRFLLLLFATGLAAGPLAGEEPLREGSRVRVSREGGRRIVGVLKSIDHERLLVEDDEDGDWVFVPVAVVKKVEVSQSSRPSRPWSERMLIGAGAGLATGAAVGYLGSDAGCHGCDTMFTPLFGVLGAGAGALVGLAVRPADRWTDVPKRQLGVSVAPLHGGGVAASLSVRF